MGLRRIAACDQRRRRVLIEENLSVVGSEGESVEERQPSGKVGSSSGNSYSDAAALTAQPPCVSVLASRPFTQVIVALSCLLAIVGLLAAYAQWRLCPTGDWQTQLASLDMARPGSLAAWVCSLMLATAAFQGIQIYRLRRHKTDDYRGRYRVWTWIPVLLLAGAAGVATGVHRELTVLIVGLFSPDPTVDYAAWWPMAAASLWLLVAVRLGFEMKHNRWSLASLAIATMGYLAGMIAAEFDVQPISQMLVDLLSFTLIMIGHLGVFVAVMSFGHYVYLDSQGLLPVETAKPRKRKTGTRDSASGKKQTRRKIANVSTPEPEPSQTETEGPQSPPEAAPAILQLDGKSDETPEDGDESDESSSQNHLSKTERRRLKKMRKQEQFRRAA